MTLTSKAHLIAAAVLPLLLLDTGDTAQMVMLDQPAAFGG